MNGSRASTSAERRRKRELGPSAASRGTGARPPATPTEPLIQAAEIAEPGRRARPNAQISRPPRLEGERTARSEGRAGWLGPPSLSRVVRRGGTRYIMVVRAIHRRQASARKRRSYMDLGMVLTYMRARFAVSNEKGQTLVEYALIITLIALACVLALGFLSGKIQSLFSKTGSQLETS